MCKFVQLSYGIDEEVPLYPGTSPLEIRKIKEIDKGDSCNTFSITLSNHSGTHIDTPMHFWKSGRGVKEYPAHKLACKNPLIIDCPKRPGEIIEVKDLTRLAAERESDALLIRTGFYKYRSSDAGTYCNSNPSLSPEAADWIRQNLQNLKILGIDSISISSSSHRETGARAHKILLTDHGYGGDPVLILEDLYLPGELKRLSELLVFPIFAADIDSSPCTVIGVIHD